MKKYPKKYQNLINQNLEDILNIDQDGPNRPAYLNLRLSKLFTIFPTEVTDLSNFLDGNATFTYQVAYIIFVLVSLGTNILIK